MAASFDGWDEDPASLRPAAHHGARSDAVAPHAPHAVIGYGVDHAVLCRRLECESFARLEADALQRHVDLRADDAVVVADHELRRPERIRPLAATLSPNRATATSGAADLCK